jgi:tyrosine-protein kinase Etk/Wzc
MTNIETDEQLSSMKEAHISALETSPKTEDREFGILDLAIAIAKHKKLVAGSTLAGAFISALISFSLSDVYETSTKILPPQQSQSSAAALLSQLGGAAGSLAAGVAGLKNPSDLYIGMLRSRTIADNLIATYDLKKVYEQEYLEKTRKKLAEHTSISGGKDGLITIGVEDHDKDRAAKLANSYVEELVKLTRTLAITEASQRRLFYERQLEMAKNNLANAEIALKSGLDARGVTNVDVESRAIAETIGRLRAQISAKEIQLNSMRPFMTENNPSLQRVAEELNSLRRELSRLENGQGEKSPVNENGTNNKVGLENIKLLRDVKYYQMLYELLAKQYEVARLDEAKDPAIIQVLDLAVAPERRSGPKRIFIIVLSTIFAFFGSVAWALLREAKQKMMRSAANAARWAELKSYLRSK